MIVWKVQRKFDGFFSRGGRWPTFSRSGKTWSNKSAFSNHLNCIQQGLEEAKRENRFFPIRRTKHPYEDDCEIIAIEVKETELNRFTLKEYNEMRGLKNART